MWGLGLSPNELEEQAFLYFDYAEWLQPNDPTNTIEWEKGEALMAAADKWRSSEKF